MSLNWTVTGIANHQAVTTEIAPADDRTNGVKAGDRIWKGITTALVWRLAAIGIGTITEKTAEDVFVRSSLLSLLDGPPPITSFVPSPTGRFTAERPDGVKQVGDWVQRDFTVEEIRQHIGLSTNVTYERLSVWRNRILDSITRELADQFQRGSRALVAAAAQEAGVPRVIPGEQHIPV